LFATLSLYSFENRSAFRTETIASLRFPPRSAKTCRLVGSRQMEVAGWAACAAACDRADKLMVLTLPFKRVIALALVVAGG
jgi:hypothetical protein